jgi:hypothetical protein
MVYQVCQRHKKIGKPSLCCAAGGACHPALYVQLVLRDPKLNDYLQLGLMPCWLMAYSFQYFMKLLNAIQLLAFGGHSDLWDQEGPSLAMLCHHSDNLLTIQQNTLTRKALVLHTYAYLLDAKAKSFYHESMTKSLWDWLMTILR